MKKKKSTAAPSGAGAKTTPPPATPPPSNTPSTTSGFKGFVLLVASVILIFIFLGLQPNKLWFNDRIMGYWEDFKEQKLNLDVEERKLGRYQNDYLFARNVTAFFDKKGITKNALVLMPPTDYFKAHGLPIHVAEPAVFYYFTGLKTIWANSPEASQANWYVNVRNGQPFVDSVTNKSALLDTIAAFKKYNISL